MNLVVTVVRDGIRMTRDAVNSFKAQDIPTHTYIVSNHAPDNLAYWIRSQDAFEGVTCLNLIQRKSVAACWNKALRRAFGIMKLRYVLVANNDVILRPDTYRLLVEADLPFATGVGVNTMEQMAQWDGSANLRPNPDFSCFLIRREVWEKVGEFDENFAVAFCEDNDYHCRMHKAGIPAVCVGVPFFHVGSGTLKVVPPKEQRLIEEAAAKNREYFKTKWGFSVGSPEYEAFFTSRPDTALPLSDTAALR